MSNVVSNQNPQPTNGTLSGALKFRFIGALDFPTYDAPELERPVWPDRKPETEMADQPTQSPSYSLRSFEFTDKQTDYDFSAIWQQFIRL